MASSDDMALIRPSDVLVAGALLTRLPLPHAPRAAFDRQAAATWAYPLMGVLLGALTWLVWAGLGALGLPLALQAGLSLGALTMMTGALHEDGLADTADGLWGGHDMARRLEIMKDSRIGSYGVLALVFGVGLRWLALMAAGPVALITAAALSRGLLPAMMHSIPFARTGGLARSVGKPSMPTAALALTLAVVVALALHGILAVQALGCAVVVMAGLGLLARRKLGGITGDILGAAQTLAELAILLVLIPQT